MRTAAEFTVLSEDVEACAKARNASPNSDLVKWGAALREAAELQETHSAAVARAYAEAYADGWRYRALHPREGIAADPARESEAWMESRARALLGGTNGKRCGQEVLDLREPVGGTDE